MKLTKTATCTNAYKAWKENDKTAWDGSLFELWNKISSPKRKGAEGEKLAADILEKLGAQVLRDKNGKHCKPKGSTSDFDIYVDNHKVEVKCSSAWAKTGREPEDNSFRWQQIRSLQEYDRVVFIGINPNELHMWWCTKEDLKNNIFGKDKHRQHAGKDGKQELYWIKVDGKIIPKIPSWFREMSSW